jgi:hypothetical protein
MNQKQLVITNNPVKYLGIMNQYFDIQYKKNGKFSNTLRRQKLI